MNDFTISDRQIKGDVLGMNTSVVPQISPAEFLELIDAVLDTPGIEALKWTQYTPYFNDGEPCEFDVREGSVKLSEQFGTAEEGDYGDGWLDEYSVYGYTTPGDYGKENREYSLNGHSTVEIKEALEKFNAATSSFESVARANFGDHAEVTATKEGFSVEYYEHD